MKPEALLGLGSNLGDRLRNLRSGIAFLEAGGAVDSVRYSSLYASEPVECEGGEFLNAVVAVRALVSAKELLEAAGRAERNAGRTGTGGDARPLDVDILYYGDLVVREQGLTLPHPGRLERAFVLVPLGEVCGEVIDPETGRLIHQEVSRRAEKVGPPLRLVMGSQWLKGCRSGGVR
ncbi:MAG: 2-amino-4-hydroxy-6-hydroxymethyldihydropteridine diphosphokinase [Deltaproteobacteria bacterium]|nr:2-amino-4-hydroxy-6-hydroxymethyldihydropteridine diphosphokinase [Deltaproteobacteria bacterium]